MDPDGISPLFNVTYHRDVFKKADGSFDKVVVPNAGYEAICASS